MNLVFKMDKAIFNYRVAGIYKWTTIEELKEINLLPDYLRTALTDLPKHLEHFVEHS